MQARARVRKSSEVCLRACGPTRPSRVQRRGLRTGPLCLATAAWFTVRGHPVIGLSASGRSPQHRSCSHSRELVRLRSSLITPTLTVLRGAARKEQWTMQWLAFGSPCRHRGEQVQLVWSQKRRISEFRSVRIKIILCRPRIFLCSLLLRLLLRPTHRQGRH